MDNQMKKSFYHKKNLAFEIENIFFSSIGLLKITLG